MILSYLAGLAIIAGFVIYPIIFNTIWYKLTGEDMLDNNAGLIGYIIMPYILTMAFFMVLAMPLIIGKGLWDE